MHFGIARQAICPKVGTQMGIAAASSIWHTGSYHTPQDPGRKLISTATGSSHRWLRFKCEASSVEDSSACSAGQQRRLVPRAHTAFRGCSLRLAFVRAQCCAHLLQDPMIHQCIAWCPTRKLSEEVSSRGREMGAQGGGAMPRVPLG